MTRVRHARIALGTAPRSLLCIEAALDPHCDSGLGLAGPSQVLVKLKGSRQRCQRSQHFDLSLLLFSFALLELRVEPRGAIAATPPHHPATTGHPATPTPPAFPLPQWQGVNQECPTGRRWTCTRISRAESGIKGARTPPDLSTTRHLTALTPQNYLSRAIHSSHAGLAESTFGGEVEVHFNFNLSTGCVVCFWRPSRTARWTDSPLRRFGKTASRARPPAAAPM